jgi:hypothetical protein
VDGLFRPGRPVRQLRESLLDASRREDPVRVDSKRLTVEPKGDIAFPAVPKLHESSRELSQRNKPGFDRRVLVIVQITIQAPRVEPPRDHDINQRLAQPQRTPGDGPIRFLLPGNLRTLRLVPMRKRSWFDANGRALGDGFSFLRWANTQRQKRRHDEPCHQGGEVLAMHPDRRSRDATI